MALARAGGAGGAGSLGRRDCEEQDGSPHSRKPRREGGYSHGVGEPRTWFLQGLLARQGPHWQSCLRCFLEGAKATDRPA